MVIPMFMTGNGIPSAHHHATHTLNIFIKSTIPGFLRQNHAPNTLRNVFIEATEKKTPETPPINILVKYTIVFPIDTYTLRKREVKCEDDTLGRGMLSQ